MRKTVLILNISVLSLFVTSAVTSVLANFPDDLVTIKENTSAIFRNVTLKLPANANYQNIIHCAAGSQFRLENSTVLSDGALAYVGFGIEAGGSSLDILYSSITVSTNNENIPVALLGGSGDINVNYSEIKMTSLNGIEGIDSWGKTKISNSIIKTHSLNGDGEGNGAYNVAVAVNGPDIIDIQNSEIVATSANGAASRGVNHASASNVNIKNSVVSGTEFGIYTYNSGLPGSSPFLVEIRSGSYAASGSHCLLSTVLHRSPFYFSL